VGLFVLQKQIPAKRSDKLVMYAFDLLYLNGNDLRAVPLEERKERLRDLIRPTGILFSDGLKPTARRSSHRPVKWESRVEHAIGSRRRRRQRETLLIVGYALTDGRFDDLYLGGAMVMS
jgi:bifunctional non-homologous end joining protein LigD